MDQVQRHAGFTFGRQHDAAECLRQVLIYSRLGQRFCDTEADLADGGVVICYTPDVAQVSAAAAAVDARGLLLEAKIGEEALKLARK